MSRAKRWQKVAAFVPALVFVVPFVAYRAGAFDRFTKPEAPLVEQQPPDEELPPTFMYSSKSARVFVPAEAGAPQPAPAATDPTFMAGSKSIILAPAPNLTAPAAPAPAPNAPKP